MFAALAPAYDRFNRISSLGLDRLWRRRAVRGIPPGASVLDLGCGTGDLSLAAWRRTGAGGRVVGVDFAEPMLALARAKARAAGAEGVEFVRAGADALPFPDASFDAVVSAFVLRSLAAIRREAAREIARVLKPGGRAFLLELTRPAGAWLRALHRAYLAAVIPAVGRAAAGRRWPGGYLAATILEFPEPGDYAGWFTSQGMKLVEAERLAFGAAGLVVIERGRA